MEWKGGDLILYRIVIDDKTENLLSEKNSAKENVFYMEDNSKIGM